MATARANIRSEISLDASKFSATLRKLPGMANTALKKVSDATARVAKSMANLAAQTAKWAMVISGAAIVGLTVRMVKLAASAEQTAVAFKVMTGSAGAASKVLSDLRKMAEKTPFGFADLAESSKTLLAFGIEAGRIVPIMQRLGDISGGNAEKLKSVALVFGQIAAAGKLTGGDLLQLINVGFNPLQQIAERTGESMGDLRKRMEAGKISFAEFERAVEDATNVGGRFFGMMEAQSKTAAGLFSTLTDAFDTILLKLGEPINQRLVTFLQIAITETEKLIPMADKVGQSLGKWLDSITAQFGSGSSIWAIMGDELELVALKFAEAMKVHLSDAFVDSYFALMDTVAKYSPAYQGMKAIYAPERFSQDGEEKPGIGDKIMEIELRKLERKKLADPYGAKREAASQAKAEAAATTAAIKSNAPVMPFPNARIPARSANYFNSTPIPDMGGMPTKGGPFALMGTLARVAQSMVTNPMTMAGQAAKAVMLKTQGFGGLAGGATMQAQRLAGIGPGTTGIFAQDRARLGIKSGLSTGGLGATRRIGRQKDEAAEKRAVEMAKTTNEHLYDIKQEIFKSLTVA